MLLWLVESIQISQGSIFGGGVWLQISASSRNFKCSGRYSTQQLLLLKSNHHFKADIWNSRIQKQRTVSKLTKTLCVFPPTRTLTPSPSPPPSRPQWLSSGNGRVWRAPRWADPGTWPVCQSTWSASLPACPDGRLPPPHPAVRRTPKVPIRQNWEILNHLLNPVG